MGLACGGFYRADGFLRLLGKVCLVIGDLPCVQVVA